MDIQNIGTIGTSLVSGTLIGILIGYAIKKILKIGLIILGSFFGGVAYLQSQGLLNVNWERIEVASNQAIKTVSHAITEDSANSVITNLGLPLTGSMAVGFVKGYTVGFMKG
jgi:uncharacterized membrane protein (Fun14 family)